MRRDLHEINTQMKDLSFQSTTERAYKMMTDDMKIMIVLIKSISKLVLRSYKIEKVKAI